jgi:hypothetical protein
MKSRDAELLKIKKVYSLFNKISAYGNVSGFHRILTPHIMLKVFKAIDVFGRNFALCSVCTLKAKFMSCRTCTFVPNALLWTALSYSTIKIEDS